MEMGYFASLTRSIHLLLLFFCSLTSLPNLGLADPPYYLCSNNSTNSQFQKNLNMLFSYLPSNASLYKTFNNSIGDGPDRVYAQFMCLNYISSSKCSNCIGNAYQDILSLCPSVKEGVVWEEECQLRYSNRNFLGHLDVSGNIPLDNKKNISDPELFTLVVDGIVGNLTKQAAFNLSANKYATGQAAFMGTETLYAMAQCTTDLSPDDCQTCLRVALGNITSWFYFSRGARLLSRSCYLRYELYAFYQGITAESPAQDQSGKSKIWLTVIVIIIAAIVVISVFGVVVYRLLRGRDDQRWMNSNQEAQFQYSGDQNYTEFQHQSFRVQDGLSTQESPFMDLSYIAKVTNNFSESNMLGEGGFGPVYKGILSDGKEVAVKRLSIDSEQGTEEFTNEVLLIMKLQHKNLVRLLGFYAGEQEKLLVYEFMPNSSLDRILFDPMKRGQLDWSKRVNIINGIARGMLYLHQDSRLRIIHRDLKASNILLDNDMNPKISDFGMARIYAGNEGEINTAKVVGTYGYMAPEFAMEGLYSIKSDVYSFGVLLLEIITGRRNAGFHRSKRAPTLVAYAWQLWNEGNTLELLDPFLVDSCSSDEFQRYMHIGLLCIQQDAGDRPSMSSVLSMLKRDYAELPQPERPAFSAGRFTDPNEAQYSDCSANGLTVSSISPR